jgi:hypothetical protein
MWLRPLYAPPTSPYRKYVGKYLDSTLQHAICYANTDIDLSLFYIDPSPPSDLQITTDDCAQVFLIDFLIQ